MRLACPIATDPATDGLALAACDRGDKVEAPTAAQTAQLDEADRMLDTMADRDAPREDANAPPRVTAPTTTHRLSRTKKGRKHSLPDPFH